MTRTCWSCGRDQPAATSVTEEGAQPQDGDLSLCIDCGEWNAFHEDDAGLSMVKPTDEEFAELADNETCRKSRAVWAWLKQNKPELWELKQ